MSRQKMYAAPLENEFNHGWEVPLTQHRRQEGLLKLNGNNGADTVQQVEASPSSGRFQAS
jgi:hypothetical protein